MHSRFIIHCDTTRFIREVLEDGEYGFLFKNLVVVDAGCNIGAFSLWVLPYAKHIHAIDVAPANIENLKKTIVDNHIPNITTHCLALAGRNGPRWVSAHGDTAGGGGWQIRDLPGDGIVADGYTLKTFMEVAKLNHIDVLKLDIEGAEQEVLMAEDFPKDKVNTIIGEIHADADLKDILEPLGYTYERMGSHFIARR